MIKQQSNGGLHTYWLNGLSCFALIFYGLTFFPGNLTADSYTILNQSLNIFPLNDWHPVFITKLWGWLYSLVKDVGMLWFIQAASYILLVRKAAGLLKTSLGAIVFMLLTLFFPPIATNMATLWKDCWMPIFGLGCYIYTLRYLIRGELPVFIIASLCVLAFILTRYNAALMMLPFIYLLLAKWCKDQSINLHFITKFVITGLIGVGLLGLGAGLNRLLNAQQLAPWQPTAFYDIAAVSIGRGQLLEPQLVELVAPLPNLAELKKRYNTTSSDELVFRPGGYPLTAGMVSQNRKQILHTWLEAIFKHPGIYLQHRWQVFLTSLGLRTMIYGPFVHGFWGDNRIHASNQYLMPRLNEYVYAKLYMPSAQSWMYRSWVFLLFQLVLAMACCFNRRLLGPVAIALLLSGLLNYLGNFLVMPAADFRYSLWSILVSLILFAHLVDKIATNYRYSKAIDNKPVNN